MSIQLGSAYGKVSLDSSGIKTGVDSGVKDLRKLEQAGQLIGGALQKIGGAMTLGLTLPIAAFFKSSIDSAMDAENALAELKAVIASTGGAAGVTADEVQKMASELQKVTKFSDEQIVSGQSMLLTFTKIGKETFPIATEAMLNMAEKFGSIETASIQLGKALNDPIAGVSALRRVGVMLTDEQEKQIKAFMAVNDIASAQKVILDELEVEFGNLARVAGDTTAGKMAQLANAFDDLKEVVGNELIPLLLPLIEGLTKLVQKFQDMPPFVQKAILILLALVALMGPVLLFVGTVISAISSIAGFVTALGGLGITLPAIGAALAAFGTAISAVVVPAIAAIGTALIPVIIVLAAIAFYVGILYLMWKTNFLGMRDNVIMWVKVVKALWQALLAFLRGDTDAALEHLGEAFDAFRERIAKIFEGFSRFRDAWNNFMNFLRNAMSGAVNYISRSFTNIDWAQVGRFILSGIANGMLLGLPSLITMAAKVATSVLAQIKKSLGIKSPSSEAMKLGVFTAQGYMLGLQNAMNPDMVARSLARPVLNNTTSQQQNVTMQFASGLTMQQVRSAISENNEQIINTLVGALT